MWSLSLYSWCSQFGLTSMWLCLHASFFVCGWSISFQYYVPSNLFTMEYGGRHIAKLSTLQDSIQYSFVIVFDVFAGYLIKDEQWTKFFVVCAALSVVGGVASILFFIFESRAHQREKNMRRAASGGGGDDAQSQLLSKTDSEVWSQSEG
mmetsp:Transcript_4441/g.16757  ORF Transcript_4441/g.16757 Transcript_4441/m.16757 type:complete len:150 (+) Transcript_4441:1055-1504(+)